MNVREFKNGELFTDCFGIDAHIPISGSIEITSGCNLRCIHCYLQDNKIVYMDKKMIFNIVDQVVDLGCIYLSLTGGEPLTHPDFIEIYKYCKEKGLKVSVLSNSTLITDTVLDVFSDYPIELLSISMYGYSKQTYESITCVPGSYDKFITSIKKIIDRNIPLEIKAILLKQNKDEILEIQNFAKKYGIKFRFSSEIRVTDKSNENILDYAVSPEEEIEFDLILDDRRAYYEKEAINPTIPIETNILRKKNRAFLCGFGKQTFFVTADGFLHGCPRERVRGVDLRNKSFKEIWDEDIVNLINLEIPHTSPCLSCKYFSNCRQCAAEMDLRGDISKPIEEVCKLAQLRTHMI